MVNCGGERLSVLNLCPLHISPDVMVLQKCHTSVEQGRPPVVELSRFRGTWLSWDILLVSDVLLLESFPPVRIEFGLKLLQMMFTKIKTMN